jgi:phosphoglycerate dehydrogenase-like enzyme
MNRRHFLVASTSAAVIASSGGASTAGRDTGRPKVIVPSMEPADLADLKAAAPGVELVECASEADAIAHAPNAAACYGFITTAVIRAGKSLKWVQQGSAGVENVLEIPGLVDSEIILTNMQRIYAPEIADQAMGYLLAFTRSLGHFIRTQSAQEWRSRGDGIVLDELMGKTMVVIGLGGIGTEIARRAYGFGMRVIATDPKVLERPLYVEELRRPDALASLLPRADVVASAVPLTKESFRMLGSREFATMKRGVVLINVSRGKVVDTDALIAALDSRQVAAAGLDVTDPEPLPKGHPLWSRNAIITPHSAGQSPGGERRRHELFRENLHRFAAGEMLLNIVDKRAGY